MTLQLSAQRHAVIGRPSDFQNLKSLMHSSSPSTDTSGFTTLMQRGSLLHQEGRLPQALLAFEEAMKAAPGNLDACSAAATMLSLLGRHAAAYRILLDVEAGLKETADGAANLAIAAESCGDIPKAHKAYERALQMEPDNLRALTNVGLIAAGLMQWDMAIACARKCVALQPANLSYRQTLSDVLTSARRYPEALEVLDEAGRIFPGYLDITVRRVTVLAFSGALDKSEALASGLDAPGKAHLQEFLAQSLKRPATSPAESSSANKPFSAAQLFAVQAFAAMAECDWRDNASLYRLMSGIVEAPSSENPFQLPEDSPLHALTLDMDEALLAQVNAASLGTASEGNGYLLAPWKVKPRKGPIRIGFAIQDLRQLPALKQQLSCCDRIRFLFHVYSFALPPASYEQDALQSLAIPVIEMAHMTDAEAVGRIRLDALDIYIDTAPDARVYRSRIASTRVAAVQIRQHTWFSSSPTGSWDYTVSDGFLHSVDSKHEPHSPMVRIPSTCWLSTHAETTADTRPTRESAGLPAEGLVLCSHATPASLDEYSFSRWMKIIRSLPDAVLWLPACNVNAAVHLVREAAAHGVQAHRLLFSPPMSTADMLAGLVHADLLLDTVRVSQAQGVEDALHAGLPLITCAGTRVSSRLGGSILHAAGLPELVTRCPEDYVTEAVRLGRDAGALQVLRQRIKAAQATSSFFDLASRLGYWQSAWTVMAERSRAGLVPISFDVSSPSAAIANGKHP